jgi:two-component system nitrate/nitrite response regulator NarL
MNNDHAVAPISVMIADDHSLLREALAQTLGTDPNLSVSTADSYDTALTGITNLGKVDVLLLDVVMPGMDGLRSIEEFVKFNANGAIVVFSGNASSDFIDQALAFGARGFIPKTLPLRSLVAAIQLIALGQIFVPVRSGGLLPKSKIIQVTGLSPKELIVLDHVSDGLTNKEIAWEIGVVEVTVKMHMRSICSKLKAKNRAHAVIIASQSGLLQSKPYL